MTPDLDTARGILIGAAIGLAIWIVLALLIREGWALL